MEQSAPSVLTAKLSIPLGLQKRMFPDPSTVKNVNAESFPLQKRINTA
jgi:hypothetical protein